MTARGGRQTIKSLVLLYLQDHRPRLVDESVLHAIETHIHGELSRQRPVSRSYVLEVVSSTEIEVARSLGGLPVDLRRRVHVGGEEDAAASLIDLQREYQAARDARDSERARDVCRAVRQGKQRLRLILRRPSVSREKRAEKQELLEWFLVWLENPKLFSEWLGLRRRAREEAEPAAIRAPSVLTSWSLAR